MLTFGRLKGEKTPYLRKIITYSPERFSDSSPLVLSFRVLHVNLNFKVRQRRSLSETATEYS